MGSNQHNLVVQTLQKLGGVATLSELYREVPTSTWNTRTPDATIRRIVQTEPRLYRIKPGVYALEAKRQELEKKIESVNSKSKKQFHIEEPVAPFLAGAGLTQPKIVLLTLERLGGLATLADLYRAVPKQGWATKTPNATIRRIVQTTDGIYKLRPGLYGLTSNRSELESKGIIAETEKNKNSPEMRALDHSFYQGVLLKLGSLRGYECWSPNQDSKKLFQNTALGSVRTLQKIPAFSHTDLVRKSSTVDVIWFNRRMMPENFFEVEHSTDIYNSLRKFAEFQDFRCNLVVVADAKRRAEFDRKKRDTAFRDISNRVEFLSYKKLEKRYEQASEAPDGEFQI